MAASHPHLF
jgi:hypothetical protein